MTFEQIIKGAIPNATPEDCEHVLWGMTPFPCAAVSPKELYRAASRKRRAEANGIRLCDHCSNKAEPGDWNCKPCNDVLRHTQ